MLWRGYIALHALGLALAVAVGATWVVRTRLDLDRWPSIATFAVVMGLTTIAAYVWLRTSTSGQLRSRAWRLLRIEFLALGGAAAFFAVTDITDLFSASDASPYVPEGSVAADVIRTIDGDTIEVRIDGESHRVRYIGMDAPETVHPARGVEPYGIEASNLNKKLVEGKQVWLEKDVSETDQYGRLLRYVWLPDGHMVNLLLVEEGYAQVDTWPPDVRYQTELLRAQREAQQNDRGLWNG